MIWKRGQHRRGDAREQMYTLSSPAWPQKDNLGEVVVHASELLISASDCLLICPPA